MKRPQGFDDRATRPRVARQGAQSDAAAAPTPGGAALRGRAATPTAPAAPSSNAGSAPRDRALTEPIVLPVAPAAHGRAPATAAPEAAADRSAAAPAPTPGGPVPPTTPSDARAARRAVAAAARERRRYEKQEVRRFTKRSRMRRIAWIVGLGSIVALVVLVVAAAYSPLMALREVRVEGANRIPVDQLTAAFADQLGTPLPLITSEDVHRSLADFSLIETYSTETIPPGTLVVRIVERTPVGVVDTSRGLELVDAAGVVIDRPETRPEGMPLIETEGGVAGEGFRAAAAVVRSLPADVRSQLERVTAATADDVRFDLVGGANVVWGSADDSGLKATVLARLMQAAPPDQVSRYDVSAPMSPVTE